MGQASLADIVSNQGPDPSAVSAAPVGGTAHVDDIVANHGPADVPPAPGTTGLAGFVNKIGETGAGVATGFVKGMGDTVSGVSHLINKIPVVGETLAPKAGISALDTLDTTNGTAEAAGKGLEGIAEFAAGDELMEGLSKGAKLYALAKKYPLINEMMMAAKEHPVLAKIITGGAKSAAVGGAEGAVKGAQQDNAVKGAAVGAGTGAVIGSVPGVVSGLKNPFRKSVQAFTGSQVQPQLQSGIRDVWNAVADEAKVARPTAPSIQDAGEEVADSILARSKSMYKDIDAATEGRFSGTEQDLRSVNKALRSVTNDTEEAALLVRKTRLELQMNQLLDDAALSGVDASDIAKAKSDFKQAQAIYDTNHQIRMSTTGVRPGMKGAAEVPEEVNAKTLLNRLTKLDNKDGRLTQAVGADHAEDLIAHSAIAQKAAKDIARNRKVAAIAVPGVAGAVGETYRALH